ncbi:MAG: N-acetylglucosamine-6-phosphate deacetylase [Acidobacteriota bacterium]
MTQDSLFVKGKLLGQTKAGYLTVSGGRIQSIDSEPSAAAMNWIGSATSWVLPAFFDIQVNGFSGVDFNSGDLVSEQLEQSVAALRRKGVLFFFATVITHSEQYQSACLRSIDKAIRASQLGRAVAGIHLEGPFISPQDGPRGAHPAEHVRPPNFDEFQRLQESAGGRIRLVTVAPEWDGAISLIERLVKGGIVVAIGHTAANRSQIEAAASAGALCSTHLGNGSHALLPRHENYIWEQLADDRLWASFIVDGHHLPPAVVKSFIRAKGVERSILTSDAIAAAGMPPGCYRLGDVEVTVSPSYRVERTDQAGSGYLAGSALDLARGVENACRFAGVTLAQAVQMASTNPARLMGCLDKVGTLVPGQEANLLVVEWEDQSCAMTLKHVVSAGDVVYSNFS